VIVGDSMLKMRASSGECRSASSPSEPGVTAKAYEVHLAPVRRLYSSPAVTYRHGVADAAVLGFVTGLTLIAAIGAQNAFVLRQGIRGEHVAVVAGVCAMADVILIAAGIAGIGALITAHPQALTVARIGGAVFLIGYGLLAARRALRPATLTPATDGPAHLVPAVLTCLALTFLNPHVYLDTVVLLGTLANQQGDGRWLFGGGAALASTVWFFGLGFGARRVAGLFAAATTWRILDAVIAVTMIALGVSLALT
jgi:L-lysine exporter family protein LysE/ArgO